MRHYDSELVRVALCVLGLQKYFYGSSAAAKKARALVIHDRLLTRHPRESK